MSMYRPAESTLSDDEGYDLEGSEEADELQRKFAFPDLDAQIREAISDYGAVFPKLNFSSPRVRDSNREHLLCSDQSSYKSRN